METLLLQSESKKDIKIMAELAKKIGFKTKMLNDIDMEAIGLVNAMKKGRTGEYINAGDYLKKLKGK
jgi:hypothetical protein